MVLSEETPIGDNCLVRNEWICPEYLTPEVEEILTDLGVRASASIFLVLRRMRVPLIVLIVLSFLWRAF